VELAVLGVAFSPHPRRARALNSFELVTGSNVSIGSGAGGAVVGCDGPAASGPGVLASQQRHTLLPRLVLAVPHGAGGRKRGPGAGAARAVNWLAHVAAEQKGDFLILLGIIFARTRAPRDITHARSKPKHKKQRLRMNPANYNEPRKQKVLTSFF
jgi:hypothetical protein